MDQIFILALLISVSFLICKVLEIKFIKKEPIAPKDIIRDTLLVYVSSVIGIYGIEYIHPSKITDSSIQVFTDHPNF